MFGLFSGKEKIQIHSDIHSHLLPGIDDGVKEYSESIEILKQLEAHGYRKIITTPHIYQEHYPNTESGINAVMAELQVKIEENGINMKVDAAAEYYMDDSLLDKLNDGVKLLSFSMWKYVLVETGFYTKPIIFDEVISRLKSQGYTPILAHPERYMYLENQLDWLKRIKRNGVMLQVSLPSLVGAYGPHVKHMAKMILKEKMVDFLASDLHGIHQLPTLFKALETKIYPQELRNDDL